MVSVLCKVHEIQFLSKALHHGRLGLLEKQWATERAKVEIIG